MIEKIERLEQQTAKTKAQLARKIEEERERQRRLEALEDVHLLAEQKFSSLEVPTDIDRPSSSQVSSQEELEVKSRRLKLVMAKFEAKRDELEDMEWEYGRERDQWSDEIARLMQVLQLKQCIIDSFIPAHYQETIEQQSRYDDRSEQWHIRDVHHSGRERHLQRLPDYDRAGNAVHSRLCDPEETPSIDDGPSVYLSYEDCIENRQAVHWRPSSRRR